MLPRRWLVGLAAILLLTVGLGTRAQAVDGPLTGSISGRVLPRGLDGWTNQTPSVVAYRSSAGQWVQQAQVTPGRDGAYRLDGLPAGVYAILFSSYWDPTGHTYEQVYDGASSLDAGTPVTVTPGSSTTDVDGTLERPSSVSGRVTDEAGHPVAGVVVSGDNAYGADWRAGISVGDVTDDQGRYRVYAELGATLRLRFEPGDLLHLDTWWPGIPGAGEESAVDLLVPLSTDLTGVDVVVRRGGALSGSFDDAPDPHGQVLPRALQRRHGTWTEVKTGEVIRRGGATTYRIPGLPAGVYRVCVSRLSGISGTCIGGSEVDTARDLRVATGRTTRVDYAAPQVASISGHITVASGAPPTAVHVTAYRRTTHGYVPVSTTITQDADYTLPDLLPGTYRVGFETDADDDSTTLDGTQEFWPDADGLDTARDVVLAPGQAATGRDLAVDAGATIEIDEHGEGASVTAYRRSASGAWVAVRSDPTGSEGGHLAVGGLRPGVYRLGFGVARPWFTRTVPVYWPASATLAGAGDIVVRSLTDDVTGLSVTIDRGSAIVGSLDDVASGQRQRLAGVGDVVAYRRIGERWIEESRDTTTRRLDFRFAIAGLPAGTYRVGFEPSGTFWAPAFHGPHDPTTLAGAADVVVPAATDVEGVDIAVPAQVRAVVPPRVTGVARVGRTLHAVTGLWTPSGVRFRYQWLARGRPIAGATDPTYAVRPRDRGARITVRVTGTHGSGFATTPVVTTATDPVRARRHHPV